ncbi:hypothetical protein BKE30_04535 [Alkanindiges hydrocarboniclasticus]|uniref:Uncharacterized protein n=1 Tax=Alkanindiges hydrocarboniclasticus TaxID=1907941 RepID=A0A1S8CVT6_9GAMM|nr:hypothetical protein [Alkanindiges hydrocarboniclasticus]ONG41427.1 hypothetical protein BKE30_04535 [Alkanindiges hydrocarboniclasticus]
MKKKDNLYHQKDQNVELSQKQVMAIYFLTVALFGFCAFMVLLSLIIFVSDGVSGDLAGSLVLAGLGSWFFTHLKSHYSLAGYKFKRLDIAFHDKLNSGFSGRQCLIIKTYPLAIGTTLCILNDTVIARTADGQLVLAIFSIFHWLPSAKDSIVLATDREVFKYLSDVGDNAMIRRLTTDYADTLS